MDSSPCSSCPQALGYSFPVPPGGDSTDQGTTRWIISQRVCLGSCWIKMLLARNCHELLLGWLCFTQGLDITHTPTWAISLPHLKESHRLSLSWLERWSSCQGKQLGNLPCSDYQLWQSSGTSNLNFDTVVWDIPLRQAKHSNCNIKHKIVVSDVQLLSFFFPFFCTPSTIPNQVMTYGSR